MRFSLSTATLKKRLKLLTSIVLFIYALAILQDFIFSRIKSTGFYLSESAVFNIFWILFIPGVCFVLKVQPRILTRIILSIIHLLVFTSIFILISNIAYETPHRFVAILKTVLASHFYWLLIIYMILPFFFKFNEKKAIEEEDFLILKKGRERHKILLTDIYFIKSDKPYAKIVSSSGQFYDIRSIKKLSDFLSRKGFLQLSRSALVNKNYHSHLVSRGNGDYDLHMTSGEVLRCSRHFRSHWEGLL